MSVFSFSQQNSICSSVANALAEDIGSGDITAALCDSKPINARLIAREPAVLCGTQWFTECFTQLDKEILIEWNANDGDSISAGQVVCTLKGDAQSILSGERTALNFLQTLSATATTTRMHMDRIKNTNTKLLDTRKTIPGLRDAQKYAVKCGGGTNHRMGLYDAYLIKENHIAACGSITGAVNKARSLRPDLTVEVEVETIAQLRETIACKADIALLDNFSLEQVASAVAIAKGVIQLEVSGVVTLDNIIDYANLGIDYISVGALTKHIRAIDYSMLFE